MHTFTLNFIFWTKACCYDPISCLISTLEVLRRTIDLCCRYCESSVSRTPRAINLLRILLVIWPSIPASLSFSLSNLLLQIIYAIGWSPDKSQPKACRRGSASKSLKSLGEGHGDTVITRTQQERPPSTSSTTVDESSPPLLWSIHLLHSFIDQFFYGTTSPTFEILWGVAPTEHCGAPALDQMHFDFSKIKTTLSSRNIASKRTSSHGRSAEPSAFLSSLLRMPFNDNITYPFSRVNCNDSQSLSSVRNCFFRFFLLWIWQCHITLSMNCIFLELMIALIIEKTKIFILFPWLILLHVGFSTSW